MLSIEKILSPTDFSDASRNAMWEAADLATRYQAEILLVHVVRALPALPPNPNYVLEVPEYEQALHADADRRLKALAGELSAKGLKVRTSVGHGDAGAEIVRMADAEGAGLIVIATHDTAGWQRVLLGSVAEKVVRLAHCPVLTIPAPER